MVSGAGGALVLLLAVAVLAGWVAGSRTAVTWGAAPAALQPWTAVGFVLLAAALLARGWVRAAAGGLLVALAGVMLAEYLTGLGDGHAFDRLLFPDTMADVDPGTTQAGRMAPSTAFGFLLLGTGVIVARRRPRASVALVSVPFTVAYVALVGYTFGEGAFYSIDSSPPMALPTALGLVAGSAGVAALCASAGPLALLADRGTPGGVLRRILLCALLFPPAAGLVLTVGTPDAPWTLPFRAALATLLAALGVAALGAQVAAKVAHAEVELARARAESEATARTLAERTHRLETLLDIAPVGIVETDPAGAPVWVNPRLLDITGRTTEEMSARRGLPLHPDDREAVVGRCRDALAAGRPFEGTFRLVAPDGRVTVVQCAGTDVRDAEGTVTGRLNVLTDVTRMNRAEARFRAAFEDAPVGMVLVGDDDRITQANRAMAEMLHTTPEDLAGRVLASLVHPDDVELLAERLVVPPEEPASTPRRDLRWCTSGDPVWSSVHAVRLDQAEGFPARHLLHVLDVTERHEHEQRLAHLADHDPLTGLLNRRAFDERLREALDRMARYGGLGALLLFDLDGFKAVNDTLGHGPGDELLVHVAERLQGHLRTSDLLGRLGGDEFAVYLPYADRERAATVAEKVRASVRATAVTGEDGVAHHVTASVGLAVCGPDACDAGALFRRADGAMYDAKYGGRDRCVVAGGGDRAGRPQPQWARRLERALADDRLVLYAQPIIDLRTRATRRYEVLVRLLDEDGTLVPPAAFLQEAERLGAMGAVDHWVVTRAIDLAAALSGPQPAGDGSTTAEGPSLEINLSGRSLADPDLVARVASSLEETGVDPVRLVFEVTETDAIAHLRPVSHAVAGLRALGCRFALDDVGAGFGSFAYLKQLPVDVLKIDGDLVRGAVGNTADRLVVEALVTVARGLGTETVAEHVVDPVVLDRMRELGVDLAQGFGVGRPVRATSLLASPLGPRE